MKIFNIVLKVILSLLLVMPIVGALGLVPPPTADMYTTSEAFAFIQILMASKYIMFIQAGVFVVALVCLWTKREALASLLLLPITVNIVGFHAFLDGGLFKAGASMGVAFFLINIYFIWKNRGQIMPLLRRSV